MTALEQQGQQARVAAKFLAKASTNDKNRALEAIAEALDRRRAEILGANARDVINAENGNMKKSFRDRLLLTDGRIDGMIQGLREVIALPDPCAEYISASECPNGMTIGRRRVPLGVIAIIFEARPNVTIDAAALCLKSGNAVILRGGKEAILSNTALADAAGDALETAGFPRGCVSLVADTSRESANELMSLTKYVDVLIPRGGAGLIRAVVENARVPVIETGAGNCHVYADAAADLALAADIIENARCSRPSVCNSAESLLVSRQIAQKFLPLAKRRLDKYNVEIRGCGETAAILGGSVVPATDEDYATEFNDFILSVKIVGGIDEAIEHIAKYSTGHSECIVTNDYFAAKKFLDEVDAAAVYVNASTRFTDGGEFGLGAEIGISTQKLHARGPMGLTALTSEKFVIYGTGQIR